MSKNKKRFTTNFGKQVDDDQNSVTAGFLKFYTQSYHNSNIISRIIRDEVLGLSSEKFRAIWPLPGGMRNYVLTLRGILELNFNPQPKPK